MLLRGIVSIILVLMTPVAIGAEWEAVIGKREIHYRIVEKDSVMLDISCSSNFGVLLGGNFLAQQAGITSRFNLIIDGEAVKNYLNPETPPDTRADFYVFWNQLKNAGTIKVEANGTLYKIGTKNLKDSLPATGDKNFICQPVTNDGMLIY